MKKQYLQPTLVLDRIQEVRLLLEPTVPITSGGGGSQGDPDPAPWRW